MQLWQSFFFLLWFTFNHLSRFPFSHSQSAPLTSNTFLPLVLQPSLLFPFLSLSHIPLIPHPPLPPPSLHLSHLTSVCSWYASEPLNSQSDTQACSLGHIMWLSRSVSLYRSGNVRPTVYLSGSHHQGCLALVSFEWTHKTFFFKPINVFAEMNCWCH